MQTMPLPEEQDSSEVGLASEVLEATKITAVAACFACALFTVLASAAVFAVYAAGMLDGSVRDMLVLAAKAVCFAGVAGVSLWAMKHCGVPERRAVRHEVAPPCARATFLLAFLGPLFFAALLVFPRLDAYPWPAPDETFHLTMARNIAEHGQYASGRPETGFILFDGYASVGPSVLLPIALAFRIFGMSLVAARVVMALYFLALCAVVFLLLHRRFGALASSAGVLFTTGSFGSVYLARSLYGEVPALFYVLLALLLWRRMLEKPTAYLSGALAGVAFALALFSKLFFVIAVAPMLAVAILDHLHLRRMTWRCLLVPAAAFAIVWGGWMTLQAVYADPEAGGAVENAGQHIHNLLFGFTSFTVTARWLLERPVTLVVSIMAVVYMAMKALRKPRDPALMILALMAPFFVFWWLFFTTGRHPRYIFYACAIAGLASGPLLVAIGRFAVDRRNASAAMRMAAVLLVVLGLSPALARTWRQARLVYTSTEAYDDLAIADYVRELPAETRLATTYWPLSRTLDFLADRHVEVLRDLPEDVRQFDMIIVDTQTQEEMLMDHPEVKSIGRYAVLSPTKAP